MPNPSVTYTLVNGTANDAGQVNTNFADIIASLTDGTKDLNMATGTFNAAIGTTATFTSLTVTNLLSTMLPTNATYDLGDATHNFKNIFLDHGATHGGRVNFNGTITSYIGSSVDGLTLGIVGFTAITTTGQHRLYDPSATNFYGIACSATPAFDLEFYYNSTPLLSLDNSASRLSGLTVLALASFTTLQLDTNISTGSAPVANTLYANSMVKAWGLLTVGGAGAVTRTEGFNCDNASWSTTDMTVNLHTAMSSSNYAVIVTAQSNGFTNVTYCVSITDGNTFVVRKVDNGSGAATNFVSGEVVSFVVLGAQ